MSNDTSKTETNSARSSIPEMDILNPRVMLANALTTRFNNELALDSAGSNGVYIARMLGHRFEIDPIVEDGVIEVTSVFDDWERMESLGISPTEAEILAQHAGYQATMLSLTLSSEHKL